MSNKPKGKAKVENKTQSFYFSIIEQVNNELNSKITENDELDLQERDLQVIVKEWEDEFQNLWKGLSQRRERFDELKNNPEARNDPIQQQQQQQQQQNNNNGDNNLNKRKPSQSLQFEEDQTLKKQKLSQDFSQNQNNNNNQQQQQQQQQQQDEEVFQENDDLFDDFDEEAKKDQDFKQKMENEQRERQQRQNEQDEINLKEQENAKNEILREFLKEKQGEEKYFRDIQEQQVNVFAPDYDDLDYYNDPDEDPEEMEQMKKHFEKMKTNNIIFGDYVDLKDTAKKWTFKLENIVYRCYEEEWIIKELKVDLGFSKQTLND